MDINSIANKFTVHYTSTNILFGKPPPPPIKSKTKLP